MRFQVLGPLTVVGPDGPLQVSGRRRRALLAVLLIHPGRTVGLAGLVDGIWPDDPPRSAVANVRTYVSDLRRQLKAAGDAPVRLTSTLTGYRLDVGADELDLLRFDELVAEGRQSLRRGDPRRAADRLGLALGLWRGHPLEDLPDLGAAVAAKLDALEEKRWAVTTNWIDAGLAMGRQDELIPVLRQLVAERRFDEQVRAQLILALHAAGRTADALAAFRDARKIAFDELGIEPGVDLQRVHAAVLSGTPLPPGRPVTGVPVVPGRPAGGSRGASVSPLAKGRFTASGPPAHGGTPVHRGAPVHSSIPLHRSSPIHGAPADRLRPSGLPPKPLHLVGREAVRRQLATIGQAVSRRDSADAHSVVVTISGPPGVGKSALALAAAYDLRHHYPDGQLYLALDGSTSEPRSTSDVLAGLLGALGVEESRLPPDLGDRTTLYRSLLADRRMLLVFDDASAAALVRPLLPGVGHCLAIVTSGLRLVELEASWRCNLEPLTESEAVQFLAALAGRDRVARAPEAAARIAAACDRLPLALRAAGIRLSTLPGVSLPTFAARLEDAQSRLDELSVGDICVRRRLSASYRSLDPTARRLFRALGRSPASPVTGATAGELLGVLQPAADRVLELLLRLNLLTPVEAGGKTQHYQMQPLMRIYASECFDTDFVT